MKIYNTEVGILVDHNIFPQEISHKCYLATIHIRCMLLQYCITKLVSSDRLKNRCIKLKNLCQLIIYFSIYKNKLEVKVRIKNKRQ